MSFSFFFFGFRVKFFFVGFRVFPVFRILLAWVLGFSVQGFGLRVPVLRNSTYMRVAWVREGADFSGISPSK